MPTRTQIERYARKSGEFIAVKQQQDFTRQLFKELGAVSGDSLTLRELTSFVTDPAVGPDSLSKQSVTRVQRWLRKHGHPKTIVNGKYGKETHDALRSAYDKAIVNERRTQYGAVARDFYRNEVVVRGESGFPVFGEVPEARELVRVLAVGGFSAQVVFRELVKRTKEVPITYVDPQFDSWRRQFLTEQFETRYGAFRNAIFPISDSQLQLMLPRHFLDLQRLNNFQDLEQFAKMRAQGFAYAQARIGIVLANAAQIQAAEEPGFWATALDNTVSILDAPGQAVRGELIPAALDAVTAPVEIRKSVLGEVERRTTILTLIALMRAHGNIQDFDRLFDYLYEQHFGESTPDLSLSAARDSVVSTFTGDVGDRYFQDGSIIDVAARDSLLFDGERTLSQFAEDHPWLNLALEIVVDPLNLIPGKALVAPFVVARKAMKLGSTKIDELAEMAGQAVRPLKPVADTLALPARGYVVFDDWVARIPNTLSVAADGLRNSSSLGLLPLRVPLKIAKAATELKPVAVERVRQSVRATIHRNFRDATADAGSPGIVSPLGTEVDDATRAVTRLIEKESPELIRPLVATRTSLFTSADRSNLSTVGLRIFSNLSEEIRRNVVHTHAHRVAYDFASKHAKSVHEATRVVETFPEELRRLYDDEYARVIESAGSYHSGVGGLDVVSAIDEQVQVLQSILRDTYIPLLQDVMEQAWVRAGVKIFAPDGNWAFSRTELQRRLSLLAREEFLDENLVKVRNPNFGRRFSKGERDALVQREMSLHSSRVFAHLRAKSDTLGGKFDQVAYDDFLRLKEIEILDAWKPSGGKWVDTRETLSVPRQSARDLHIVAGAAPETAGRAFEGVKPTPGGTAREEFAAGDDLASLFGHGERVSPVIEKQIDELIGGISGTGSRGHRGGIDRRALDRGDIDHFLDPSRASLGYDTARAIHKGIYDLHQIRGSAAQRLLSGQLAKSGLLLPALREAQSWPFRFLYYSTVGSTQAWKFTTLALRPGWTVKNTVDNTVKAMFTGVRDPRMFFLGTSAPGARAGRRLSQLASGSALLGRPSRPSVTSAEMTSSA